jgi:glyceraldehyde-3-phosphate dehydrogenase/erythrose-4-phosphate dehydrogenase
MGKIKIGINGFGRIGRFVFRVATRRVILKLSGLTILLMLITWHTC